MENRTNVIFEFNDRVRVFFEEHPGFTPSEVVMYSKLFWNRFLHVWPYGGSPKLDFDVELGSFICSLRHKTKSHIGGGTGSHMRSNA